jgi:hypothetical protein
VAKRSRIDVNRVAQAALEAALTDEREPPRRKSPLRGLTAVAAGAALATAARVAVKKAPALLPNVPRLSGMTDGLHGLRDRLADHGWIEDEEESPLDEFGEEPADELDDEPADEFEEDDEPADESEDDDEPADEAEWDDDAEDDDEDEDDEDDEDGDDDETDDDGPDASEDEEDWDEEDEEEPDEEPEDEPAPSIELGSNGGGRQASGRRTPDLMRSLSAHRRPPVMRSGERELDPADQPPEPPKRKQQRSSKQRSSKQRSSKSKSKAGGKG